MHIPLRPGEKMIEFISVHLHALHVQKKSKGNELKCLFVQQMRAHRKIAAC